VARHTSLYQSPRSPLIQGRTRWQRPLWQAWLGGSAIAIGALALVTYVRAVGRRMPLSLDAAVLWLAVGALVGAAAGAALARLWGWRGRWLGSALGGLVLGSAAYGVHHWVVLGIRFVGR
jgi:hypothetical protein